MHFSIADSVISCNRAAKVLELIAICTKMAMQVHQAPVSYETDFVICVDRLSAATNKSVVGYMHSEASGRYIVKIHMPTALHGKPDSKKQGSGKPLGFIRNAIARAVIKTSAQALTSASGWVFIGVQVRR